MSELEIQRREEYKRNRKKWILIQVVAIVVLAALALASLAVYNKMNKTYYIEYVEGSSIDYKVQYDKNDFFAQEWIDGNQAYISALTRSISADFNYKMKMDASNVSFDYKYQINSKLVVTDKSGNEYYSFTENLVPETSGSKKKVSELKINEKVAIDYVKYNEIASSFKDIYELKDAVCTLYVTLDVDVTSSSEQLKEGSKNTYSTSLLVPLAMDTFSMQSSSSVPEGQSNVIAYKGAAGSLVFRIIFIVCLILAAVGGIVLLVFVNLTKNEDITYVARIKKILRSYGSYITRMDGEFAEEGYQIVPVPL